MIVLLSRVEHALNLSRPFFLLLFTELPGEKAQFSSSAIVGTEEYGCQIYSAGAAHDDGVMATVLSGKLRPP
jgi:hypothetical protein